MTKKLERLAVDLVAKGEQFKRELAASQTQAERWGRRVKSSVAVGAGAMVAAGTAAAALTVKMVRLADDIAKNSKAAGIGAETYQAWEFAASQAGVASDKFSVSMERATKRIGEAARGFGGAKKTLDDYGISVFDVEGNVRTTEDVIREFAGTLQNMGTQAERTAAITALFGREGIRMGLVFQEGADRLKEFEDQARDLGLVIDRGILAKAEEANDQLDIMQRIIRARLLTSFAELFPTVISIGNSFAAATPKIIEFTTAFLDLVSNSERAQISNAVGAARDRIKLLEISLIEIGKAEEATLGDERTQNRLARAREAANKEIALQKQVIEDKIKQLSAYERNQKKIAADLINEENLRIGGGGLATEQPGQTFEELQADAAQRAYARRFEALSEFSSNYIERTQEIVEADKERVAKQIEAEEALRDAKISVAEDVFGVLGSLAKEDSKAQRVLFAAQKSASLARSLIALQEAIAQANKLGFPASIPAIAQAVSIGAGAISTIRGVSFGGQAHSGLQNVPREGTYLLDRGERVVQSRQNEDLTRFLQRQESGGMTVNYIEAPGSNTSKTFSQERGPNGNPLLTIRETIRSVLAEDVESGRGVAGVLERSYRLQRVGV